MDLIFVIACVALCIALLYVLLFLGVYLSLPNPNTLQYNGKHAFITGGSKGIGKALAKALIRQGCSVSLAARNADNLIEVCSELNAIPEQDRLGAVATWHVLDVVDDYEKVKAVIDGAKHRMGRIDILINNAGCACQDSFENLPISAFDDQMKINFLSAVNVTRAVVEQMKSSRSGQVVFVSSAAGQCAIWGYTAYSASKFALRGLAEALHMELLPYNVNVSILYPPNTNTEGFHNELRDMPDEIREISNTAGLFESEQVANYLIQDLSRGQFATTIGSEGWMLGVLTAGAAPEKSFARAVTQILFAGVLRGVMLIYLGNFNKIVNMCRLKHNGHQKGDNQKLD